MFSATHRATDPVIVTVEPNESEQSSDVLQQLSELLDKAIDTSDGNADRLELRRAIEHAARFGGTLDLSQTGTSLLNLPPDVMAFVDKAGQEPVMSLILPPGLDALPPCIYGLQRLSRIELDAPKSAVLDLRPLQNLLVIQLTNVPKQARLQLHIPAHCNLLATWPDGQQVTGERHELGEYSSYCTNVVEPRAPNLNKGASFPNGELIECRHLSLNVIGSWGIQDSLPPFAREMYQPLWRVSTLPRIAMTTPWELNAIHKGLRERPAEAYIVRHRHWPRFLQMMLQSMDGQAGSAKYMLAYSLRHTTCLRLFAGSSAAEGTLEHYDPNLTTTSVQLVAPCDFITMFSDPQYFGFVFAPSVSDAEGHDDHAPVADFVRVNIIPNPRDLKSGIARKDKHIKISLEFADFDETLSPAFVADLCRDGHSFFLTQLADHIAARPLTRDACLDLLRAKVFVEYSLMYREASKGNAAIVHGLGICIHAGFAKGILSSQDVFDLVASSHAAKGTLSIAMERAHVPVIEAFGNMLGMLFKAKALSQAQVKRLMLGDIGNTLSALDVDKPAVRKAYKSVLRMLAHMGALTKDAETAIRERVLDD